MSSARPLVRRDLVELEDPAEDEIHDREEGQRLDDRPGVAERGARVLELELRVHHDLQDPQAVPDPLDARRADEVRAASITARQRIRGGRPDLRFSPSATVPIAPRRITDNLAVSKRSCSTRQPCSSRQIYAPPGLGE